MFYQRVTQFVVTGNYSCRLTDGTYITEIEVGKNNFFSPVLGLDGTLYFGSGDGFLYAFDTEGNGPANAPWPMFRGNVHRSGHSEM